MSDLVDQMLQAAREDAGLQDLGDEWFLGPLQAYARDLQLPHLSEWGRAFLARLAHKDLVRRLQVVDCLKKNPVIEETALPPIAYITGHERSGTTLLHNLLSLHEKARYLSRWELMMPTPPPQASTFGSDERQALVQKSVDALRGSDLEKMHWVNADEPDECPWGFIDCTGLLGMAPSLIMPNSSRARRSSVAESFWSSSTHARRESTVRFREASSAFCDSTSALARRSSRREYSPPKTT